MEKVKFRIEYDDSDGIEGMAMVRPHRTYYGRGVLDKKNPPVLVELEFDEDEAVFAFAPGPGEELKGRSAAVEGKRLAVTADPDLYGTDADRTAAGLQPLRRLKWGEWNVVGEIK